MKTGCNDLEICQNYIHGRENISNDESETYCHEKFQLMLKMMAAKCLKKVGQAVTKGLKRKCYSKETAGATCCN